MNVMEPMQSSISKLIEGQDLSREEARGVMQSIMDGQATPSQIGGLLTALRIKGETVDEITGFAEAMRGAGGRVVTERNRLLDTCGTGGRAFINSIFQRYRPSYPPRYRSGWRSTATAPPPGAPGVRTCWKRWG